MSENPKNYIIFDTGEIYAAATDDTSFVVVNGDRHMFNGIQVDRRRGLVLNLDELITVYEIENIKEFKFL
jgi:hypothetical protein